MEKKLQRIEHGKILGGVATGLAEYLEMDVTIVRIVLILMAVFGFAGVLVYIVLWIALPERTVFDFTAGTANFGAPASTSTHYDPFVPPQAKRRSGNGRIIGGLILIGIGSYFLLKEFNFIPDWFHLHKLWPIALIIPGLILLGKSGKKKYSIPANPENSEPADETNRPEEEQNTKTTQL